MPQGRPCDTPLIAAQKYLAEAKAASPGRGRREGRGMPSWPAGPGRGTAICGRSPRHSPTACASTQPWRNFNRESRYADAHACAHRVFNRESRYADAHACEGWQGRRGSTTRAPRPAIPGQVSDPRHMTPSDPGRPARPESQRFTHSIAPGLNSWVHLFPAAVCLQTHGLCNSGSVIACFSSSSTSGPRSGHTARAVCR